MKCNAQGRVNIVAGNDHNGIIEEAKANEWHRIVNETNATLGHRWLKMSVGGKVK